jgi:calcium-dependent protein kinase
MLLLHSNSGSNIEEVLDNSNEDGENSEITQKVESPTGEEIELRMGEVMCKKSKHAIIMSVTPLGIKKAYEFQRILGQGSFGIVHQAIDRRFNQSIKAVKSVPKRHVKSSSSSRGHCSLREAYFHMQLDHPNIVKLYDVYEDSEEYHSVLEYCEGGSLVKREDPMAEKQAAIIMRQVLRALNYMHHTLHLAHRDIKAENILFKTQDPSDLTVKLCDFGFAISSLESEHRKLSSLVGSPYYIAPEILQKGYDYRCDLWSVGILLYFMLSHTFPFKG